jgi:hypothetical protein
VRVPHPRVWIAILSSAAVLYLVVGYSGRTSPGPLSAVHGREDALDDRNDCSSCHGGWFETMEEACLGCHEVIGEHMESGTGLHGVLPAAQARNCGLCHSEHHGEGFSLVNRQSFLQAGASDPEAFDHEMVGFPMAGKHLEIACSKCHEHADTDLLPKGATRFVGLEQDCAACHEDPHEGRMVLACGDCHGQVAFAALEPRDHDEALPLIGGHAEADCLVCHKESSAHSLDAIGRGHSDAPRNCEACHESPHRQSFVSGVARLESTEPAASCGVCHLAEHVSFREKGLEVSDTHHAESGFRLDLPHDERACRDCHEPGLETFQERYPGRDPDRCRDCHEDPHGGQFHEACLDCHDRERFEPHRFTAERHASAGFELVDAHLDADCAACHRKAHEESARRFRDTPDRCDDCHLDAHYGYFVVHLEELSADQRGSCAQCHDATRFDATTDFDHGRWTPFAVTDAHAQTECATCHPATSVPDVFGRRFGFAEEKFGAYGDCATCHVDPHEGAFDGGALPVEVDGRFSCERCHVQTSFRAFPNAFDHGRWTAFALDEAHADASCTACHKPLRRATESGRTWARATGARCADCHQDPHAGQFVVDGVIDCSRCHQATAWADLVFKHQTGSRFALGTAHEELACDACHTPVRVGDRAVVKYRPLPMRCVDCHDAPEKFFERR